MSLAPSQETRRVVTRVVSGGAIMSARIANGPVRDNIPISSTPRSLETNGNVCPESVVAHAEADYRVPMTQAAIEIEGLSKTYAGGKQALSDVTFDVARGSIFGLLGPNGAGK